MKERSVYFWSNTKDAEGKSCALRRIVGGGWVIHRVEPGSMDATGVCFYIKEKEVK